MRNMPSCTSRGPTACPRLGKSVGQARSRSKPVRWPGRAWPRRAGPVPAHGPKPLTSTGSSAETIPSASIVLKQKRLFAITFSNAQPGEKYGAQRSTHLSGIRETHHTCYQRLAEPQLSANSPPHQDASQSEKGWVKEEEHYDKRSLTCYHPLSD